MRGAKAKRLRALVYKNHNYTIVRSNKTINTIGLRKLYRNLKAKVKNLKIY